MEGTMRVRRIGIVALAGATAILLATSAGANAAVTVSPSSLSFGKTKVGHESSAQAVTVTGGFCGPDFMDGMGNIVPGPCFPETTDVAISGQFKIVSNNCPATLLSPLTTKATCTVAVAFKPTSKGTQHGFLRAQSSPAIVGTNLTGIGCKKKKKKGSKKKKLVCK